MAIEVPTIADADAMLIAASNVLEKMLTSASEDGDNVLSLMTILADAAKGDHRSDIETGIDATRAAINSALLTNNSLLDPVMLAYGQAIVTGGVRGSTENESANQIFTRVKQFFHDNAKTVRSRDFTRGTPTASGTNIGLGEILRVTEDQLGSGIENTFAEAFLATCVRDAQVGGAQRNREVFEITSDHKEKDDLQRTGSGTKRELTAVDASQQILLTNPGFDLFSGEATEPTDINGWESSIPVNSTNYEFDPTTIFMPARSVNDARHALQIKASTILTQRLDLTNRSVSPNTPYIGQIAVERATGAGEGTLTISWGNVSASIVLLAQVGYTVVRFALGIGSWSRTFSTNELTVTAEWARTAGDIRIDDFILAPMVLISGTWYFAVGGSVAFSQNGTAGDPDTFKWSDSETGIAVVNKHLDRGGYGFLPHSLTPTLIGS